MVDILFTDTGGLTRAIWGDSVARINDQSPNGNNALQGNAALQGKLGRAAIGATPSATLDGGSGPAFLRLDLSDDRYPTTYADGGTFDVLIAGRGGSWIERDVVIAPGGDLVIGPSTIPNGPAGLLSAIGGNPGVWADIVGVTIIDRTITAGQQAQLVAFYRARGAKGLLVPGPELITDAGFDDPDYWPNGNSNFVVADSVMTVNSTGTVGRGSVDLGLTAGALYLVQFEIVSRSNGTIGVSVGAFTTSGSPATPQVAAPGVHTAIVIAGSSNARFNIVGESFAGVLDNASLRRLTPEEDM